MLQDIVWYLQNTVIDVVGDIASNISNSTLVALHQYTPSFTLVMAVIFRVLLTVLSELIVSINTFSVSFAISSPSLYHAIVGNGRPSVLHSTIIVSPSVALITLEL